jgi:hypothetical protein
VTNLHRYYVARLGVCGAAGCCGDLVLVCGEHGEVVRGGGAGRSLVDVSAALYGKLDISDLVRDHESVYERPLDGC